jgi:4-hydroxybenzoate polyprenyltransferase
MTIGKLIRIARPRFNLYLLGPYLIGSTLGFTSIQILLKWQFWLGFVYFTLPANLLIYGVNDIFDYETDKLNPKKQTYEALVTPAEHTHLWTWIMLLNVPFVLVFCLFYPMTIVGLLGFLFFGIQYSAPPIRAKATPFLDSIFNILYVFPGIVGYTLFANKLQMDWHLLLSAGLWTMAMHTYSAIPDIAADRESNTHTTATVLGSQWTLMYCFVCFTLAGVLLAQVSLFPGLFITLVYGFMISVSYSASMAKLFKLYTYFPLLNTAVGFLLLLSIVLGLN